MSRYVSKDLRLRVSERAKHICEYCLIPLTVPGIEHQIEHILPIKHGGNSGSKIWL